ncbi:MAG: hypothetical protein KatS3mg053_2545 [Candidatus Roseilinea sp.]|nr:MAG: hypothetical protein KatS3mg053_2545 [Candidatus Roseilinea sp.]
MFDQSGIDSGAVYTVTVNTGSNSGTLRLDVSTTAVVTNPGGNPLAGLPFTTGEVYDVQKNVYLYLPVLVR